MSPADPLAVAALMSPRSAPREVQAPRPAILVVDDDPVNGTLTAALAERLGCLPTRAFTGRQAVDLQGGAPFSLILMDLHMPELDGFQATRLIRQSEAMENQDQSLSLHSLAEDSWPLTGIHRTPIVGMTATASSDLVRYCQEVGMDGLVEKPLSLAAFRELFNRWLIVGSLP